MTITDAILADNSRVEVSCGKRKLVGAKDHNGERYYIVYQGTRKLTETTNEDEAARILIGDK